MTRLFANLGAIMVCLIVSAACMADLKVVASPWPPYVDARLHKDGVAMHLVTEGLRRAGYESDVTIETWPRDLQMTQSGSYDVIASVWHTKQRAESLTFSEPYIINATHFFKRRESPHAFTTLADLAGLKIGVVSGYAYGEAFYNDSDFERVTQGTVLDNLRDLIAGKLDLVLADERVALYELNVNIPAGIKKVALVPHPYASKGLRIAISQKNPDHKKIADDFNSAIAAMKEDGSYAEILGLHRVSVSY